MPLPKIKTPIYSLHLPVSEEMITYRPYSVGDEKMLLAAAAAQKSNPKFYIDNTMQVIRGCIQGSSATTDLNKLTSVDVEYLLLQLRAKSVGEIVEIKYTDPETKKSENISINLEKYELVLNPEHEYQIQLTDEVGLQMRDLLFSEKIMYAATFDESQQNKIVFETIIDCIKAIYDEKQTYVVGVDCTREEVREFVDQLTGVSQKLYKFVMTMPQLGVKVKLKDGTEKMFTSGEVDFLASSQDT